MKLNHYSTGVSAGLSSRKKFLVEAFWESGVKMEFGVEKYTYEIIYKTMICVLYSCYHGC